MEPCLLVLGSGDVVDVLLGQQRISVVIDLNSAATLPEESRRQGIATLARVRSAFPRVPLFVRIHELTTGLADGDLDAVLAAAPDGVVLPGCRSGADVQHLGTKLSVREAELGIPDAATKIIAVGACDAAALLSMRSYAGSSPRLAGLAWDAERLATAFGIEREVSGKDLPAPLALARTLTIVAASAAGVPAIDTASGLNGKALASACLQARRDGFAAKFAAHAAQVPTIEAAFAISGASRGG